MATVVDSLLVQIDASTELLRKELARGADSVNQFARQTESRLGAFQSSFSRVATMLRGAFSLFGVALTGRAFANWISGAIKASDQAGETAKAFRSLKKAWDDLGYSIANSRLGKDVMRDLADAARFVQRTALPNEGQQALADIQRIQEQMKPGRIVGHVRGGRGVAETTPSLKDQLFEAQTRLAKYNSAILEKYNAEIDALSVDTNFGKLPAGMKRFDFAGAIRDVQQSAIQPLDLQNLVTKRAEGLKSFPFDQAAKDAKEFSDALAESTKRSKEFADTFAASFESRGIQALLDGDLSGAVRGLARDFAELVFRLAVLKPLAESLAGSITGTGFGKIFGFASGGRPPMGRASVVGESGPELFIPDVPGRILSNAQSRMALAGSGGVTIEQHFHNQYGNGPAYYADLAETGRLAAKTAYDAVFQKLNGKR